MAHFQSEIVVNRLLLIPDYLRILTWTFVINFNLYLRKAYVPESVYFIINSGQWTGGTGDIKYFSEIDINAFFTSQ